MQWLLKMKLGQTWWTCLFSFKGCTRWKTAENSLPTSLTSWSQQQDLSFATSSLTQPGFKRKKWALVSELLNQLTSRSKFVTRCTNLILRQSLPRLTSMCPSWWNRGLTNNSGYQIHGSTRGCNAKTKMESLECHIGLTKSCLTPLSSHQLLTTSPNSYTNMKRIVKIITARPKSLPIRFETI